jgi:tRNA 2-thiouridine synthesizing protein A
MLLHAAVRRSEAGGLIRLLATDPSTQRDVVNFCRFLEHELVEQGDADGQFSYLIRKAGA